VKALDGLRLGFTQGKHPVKPELGITRLMLPNILPNKLDE